MLGTLVTGAYDLRDLERFEDPELSAAENRAETIVDIVLGWLFLAPAIYVNLRLGFGS